MKRLQILIEEELDEALERRAREEGTSKAALIRRYGRQTMEQVFLDIAREGSDE